MREDPQPSGGRGPRAWGGRRGVEGQEGVVRQHLIPFPRGYRVQLPVHPIPGEDHTPGAKKGVACQQGRERGDAGLGDLRETGSSEQAETY